MLLGKADRQERSKLTISLILYIRIERTQEEGSSCHLKRRHDFFRFLSRSRYLPSMITLAMILESLKTLQKVIHDMVTCEICCLSKENWSLFKAFANGFAQVFLMFTQNWFEVHWTMLGLNSHIPFCKNGSNAEYWPVKHWWRWCHITRILRRSSTKHPPVNTTSALRPW